jgi:uncharacterized membrane protein YciS (DUF1049 family)
MWIIRWSLIAAVVVLVSFFIGMNMKSDQQITVNYIIGETEQLSPLVVMFFAYVAGFLTWFIISLFNFFRMRADLSAKDKLIKNLKQELNGYRSQSLNLGDDAEKTIIVDAGTMLKTPVKEKEPGTEDQD